MLPSKKNQFGGKSTPSLNTHKKPRTETKLIKYFNVLLIVTKQHPFLYLRGGSTPAIGKLFPKKGGYVSSPSHVTCHFRKTPTWARFMSLLAFYAKYIVRFHLHLPTRTALTHVLPTRLRSSSLWLAISPSLKLLFNCRPQVSEGVGGGWIQHSFMISLLDTFLRSCWSLSLKGARSGLKGGGHMSAWGTQCVWLWRVQSF